MVGEGGFARLRTGHLAALTCHRHVIHYRLASNPFGYCELPVPAWGEFEGGLVIPPQHNSIILAEGVPPQKRGQAFACPLFGGGRWIRTTEGIASRFTVCPLWPLGNSPIFIWMRWSWWTDSNPRPADYKSAALPTELHQRVGTCIQQRK